ncbi:PAS/PAC sensor protein [Sulfurimonas gotlandica GD1]|jgi:PAS domain S-box-containing protein|uniref:PAS/PAC sensor protein n=1 Tax=Sulfurimonas gotlandica (strain DSM 19862 / JCM 16533 / GD1) TaxID=929558 RepID=B6BHU5_SULGG|nr:PAS domain-containing protein [Sulfurimonas gotlandica]EDZ62886.1 PAS domain protein [Sulfurimonas gotlandica GD1]EHP30096.1 PAS/PAC sensor protein [Sulfurimonas gotlandica GD1]
METKFDMFYETEVPEDELIVSRADFSGIITYVNETFADISGYEPDELIGHPHNIIRHPDMPKSIFADLWDTLQRGDIWHGYVKNRRKDGGYYWVYARVSTVMKDGEPVEYKSVREPVSREKEIEVQNQYDKLRSQEEGITRVVLYVKNDKLDLAKKLEE